VGLFEKLSAAQGVKMLCGVTLAAQRSGSAWQFAVLPAQLDRQVKPGEYVLLALQYYSQVLTNYPRSNPALEAIADDLQEMVRRIIEEGIWTDSDLIRYAGVGSRLSVATAADAAPAKNPDVQTYVALIRPLLGDDLSLAVETSPTVTDELRTLSVIALLQGVLPLLDGPGVELLDCALRHLKSYHDEGADYSDPAVARNMANRAFREAGGDAA